jgi:hypothetical protein
VHFVLGVCIEKSGGERAYFSLFAAVYKDDFVGKSTVEFHQTVILISNKRIAEILPPGVTFQYNGFWACYMDNASSTSARSCRICPNYDLNSNLRKIKSPSI